MISNYLLTILLLNYWPIFAVFANQQKGFLKIRFWDQHSYVTIGNLYEYDYLGESPPRRRIFKMEKVKNASEEHQAQSMKNTSKKEFKIALADEIFYKMVSEKGWNKGNFNRENIRFCRSFSFEFVCKLFDGVCPTQEDWPQNFRFFNEKNPAMSVFTARYENIRKSFDIAGTKVQAQSECHLKNIELHFAMNPEAIRPKMFPLIVEITTGKFSFAHSDSDDEFLNSAFTTQEWAQHSDNGEEFKVKFRVYECLRFHYFFRDLMFMDKTGEWYLYGIKRGNLYNYKNKKTELKFWKNPIHYKKIKQQNQNDDE